MLTTTESKSNLSTGVKILPYLNSVLYVVVHSTVLQEIFNVEGSNGWTLAGAVKQLWFIMMAPMTHTEDTGS